ncbi:MAG: hypothetical protein H6815_06280 [Phycisphaeraceae bacterium]|nr:hypothetical protein [Phycisphaerales bacterium]MCB9860046.1 hypothetical protein [Phycisphaeraceae bacterium]
MTEHDAHTSWSPLVLAGYAGALAAPEVVWSLLDAGCRVVCFSNRDIDSVLGYEPNVVIEPVPDVAEGVERVVSALDELIEKHRPDVLLPMDDLSLFLLGRTHKALHLLPNAAEGTSAVPLDKRLQLDLAQKAGFQVPEFAFVGCRDDVSGWSVFPAVLKPALVAREINGKIGRSSVRHVETREDLDRQLETADFTEPWILQQYVKGVGEGLFGHMMSDHIANVSGHRRVRMMNPAGSGSSVCVSIQQDEGVVTAATKMLREINWRGMFMIELLRAEDGTLWFMELNGRAWGSMALARRQGFEYPAWTVKQHLDPEFVPLEVQVKSGLICRHLGRDIVHLLFVLRGRRGAPKDIWPGRISTMFRVLVPNFSYTYYNKRKGRFRMFFADTIRTVRAQLRKRSA